MSSITKPYTFSPNTSAASSEVNSNFDTIYNDYNGSIGATNIAASGVGTANIADSAISAAKIAANSITISKMAATMGAGSGGVGVWDSWTPTLSGRFDDGDWTKECVYTQIGKTVHFRLHLTATAAAPMGGAATEAKFTLPVTATSFYATSTIDTIGTVILTDNGTASFTGALYPVNSATIVTIRSLGTNSQLTIITSTTPFTWTTGDIIVAEGTYEAA